MAGSAVGADRKSASLTGADLEAQAAIGAAAQRAVSRASCGALAAAAVLAAGAANLPASLSRNLTTPPNAAPRRAAPRKLLMRLGKIPSS